MSHQFYGMYRCSLASFVDFAFRELHPGEAMEDNWHIRTVADLLQCSWLNVSDELTRKLIFNLPPGHLKTHICSISFPAWVLGRDPRKSVLIVSETPDMALEIRERCCELMSSKRYRYFFRRAKIVRSGKEVELNYGGRIRHAGVGYSLPQRRSDLVILDNPQSLHNLDRFDPTAFVEIGRTLRNPKEGMIILATRRLAENDLSAYLYGLRNWARIVMPVVGMKDVDWPGIYNIGHLHRKGEPLHYWYEGWEKIEQRLLEVGGEAFSWQYMQGIYKPQTTGQRPYYENGVPAGFMVGSYDPTWVTQDDFARLRQDYEAKYDPMKAGFADLPIASE